MDASIVAFLLQDGITNGAIYVLLALATIVTFSVTRITFIPQGDFVALGALTLASLVAGKSPGTLWLLIALSGLASGIEIVRAAGRRDLRSGAARLAAAAAPGLLALAMTRLDVRGLPYGLCVLATLAIVIPIGPLIYRIVYQPIQDASVITLLIVSAALHYVLAGLTLYFFGPEGVRTPPLSNAVIEAGDITIGGQAMAVLGGTALILLLLYTFFAHTLVGKGLRAAASNRVGSQLVGISVPLAGMLALSLSALIGALSGILISPIVTVFYDTGFGIGLRGFVGAIFGGLTSYPLAALGALFVGIAESFASFYASQFRDSIVFLLIVPVLAVLSVKHRATED